MKNRLSITVEESTVTEIDAYAKDNDLNRSEAIEALCKKALENGSFFNGPTVTPLYAIAPLDEVYALMASQNLDASQYEDGLRIPIAELTLRISRDDYKEWMDHMRKTKFANSLANPIMDEYPETGVKMFHISADDIARRAKSAPKPRKPSPKPKVKHP